MLTVSLDEAAVIRKILVPDVQPPLMAEEWIENTEQIKADPGFRAALARRGITDMSLVQVDPWPASNFGLEIDASGRRLARGVAYLLGGPGSNPYARPIENLVALLDRDTGEVLEIEDGEAVPIPRDAGRYDAASAGELRHLSALQIVQPDGPGFTVDDGCLTWGPWQMRRVAAPDRGTRAAPDRLSGPRAPAAHHLPGGPVRDDRAVWLYRDEPLVEERVRRRRRRPGQDGQPAGTRLRVPG